MTYDHEYFACVCQDDARAEAEEHLQRAYASLGEGTDASNLLSRVVYGLNWDIGKPAHITEMACDQWAGIWAETYEKKDDESPLFSVKIQCDVLEHGIAALWNAFNDRFPREGAA